MAEKMVRQNSHPGHDDDAGARFPGVDKEHSFKRNFSDPGPEGMVPLVQRNHTWNVVRRFAGKESPTDLLRVLREGAIKEKRKPPWALIAAIVFFNVIGKIGDAVGPAMVGLRPVSLLLLNASNTHCILTTTTVAFVPWIVIGSIRRFCEDPLYFYAGWKYRKSCLEMLRKWSPDMADGYDKAEGFFRNNLYIAVAVNPGATVCSLAGASRMAPVAFFSLNVGSTVAQLLVMRYICLMFPDRIDEILGLIKRYMLVLVIVMVGLTFGGGALSMLRGNKEHAD